MIPVMLQLYNVREDLKKDFDGTLEHLASMGYRYVELAMAQSFGRTASQFREALDRVGLSAISAHVAFRDMTKDTDAVLSFYLAIGCQFIAIPFLTEDDRYSGAHYEEVKKEIAALGEEVNKRGAVLLYHNHVFEFESYNGKYVLDDLYDSIPASLLQTQIDICWAKVGGVDPAQYILKYKGRAPVVHLKDFDEGEVRKDAPFPFRCIGEGSQDIPSVIKASVSAGAKWFVVEQDLPSPGKTALECARDSLNYLKSVGGEGSL